MGYAATMMMMMMMWWCCTVPVALGLHNCSWSGWKHFSDKSLRMRHVINPATRTVTVEVESSYNDSGWLGFGFTNKPKMVGSKAVIGLPRRRRGGTVRVYALSMATVGRRCDGSRRPAC
jgi:hypothetical protein